MTQQMAATQHVLEVTEEDFNRPQRVVHQRDDFCQDIQHVSSDANQTVTVLACRARVLSA